jgi:hypothetical protein
MAIMSRRCRLLSQRRFLLLEIRQAQCRPACPGPDADLAL